MFRGIGVTTFRANGYTEAKVALWTSVIFGLAHSTSIFTAGAGAIPQVLVTAAAGLFFYLCRRLGCGPLLPVLLHAAWDYSLFTGKLGEDPYVGGLALDRQPSARRREASQSTALAFHAGCCERSWRVLLAMRCVPAGPRGACRAPAVRRRPGRSRAARA